MSEMFRSAVFKLTAAYVTIVMSISIIFSAVLYNLAVQELQVGFQNQYTLWLTEYKPFGLREPGDPAAELAERSAHMYNQLVYLNLMVFLVTGAASYVLARRTLRPIERAHEHQKRFTADVSHELRTPLTSIKMETEVALLDKKAPARELRTILESNLEEAKRMESLINNLLQLASMEANQLRTEFSRLNVREIVESAQEVVSRYANMRHLDVRPNLKDAYVIGDRSSLIQLLIILLENAIKYSPEHSSVGITINKKAQYVSVTIEDSGIGISPEALPHIFDRFYRADNARTTEQSTGGFGLGLSLAKLIADLHGGEIIISSIPDKGTKATVRLPIAPKK